MSSPSGWPTELDRAQFFQQHGIVRLPESGLAAATLDAAAASLHGQYGDRPRRPNGVHYLGDRIMNAWLVNPHVRELALAPAVLKVLAALFGRQPRAFQTLNFEHGTQQSAHSDALHFNSDQPGFLAAAWIALEDVDERNGPLFYSLGSHHEFPVTVKDLNNGTVYDDIYRRRMKSFLDRSPERTRLGIISRGEVLIWDGQLVHGGFPVCDGWRTRHSQVTHYLFDGCQLWTPKSSRPGQIHWRSPRFIAP